MEKDCQLHSKGAEVNKTNAPYASFRIACPDNKIPRNARGSAKCKLAMGRCAIRISLESRCRAKLRRR